MAADAADGGEVYGDYIREELDRQLARKTSFETRGLSVITTAGTLVTLLFALATLSTREEQTFVLPRTAQIILVISVVCFLVAIAAALATNLPVAYKHVLPSELRTAVKESWDDSASVARRRVAHTRVDALESARKLNGVKAWILFGAITAEFLALVLVGIAVAVVIAE